MSDITNPHDKFFKETFSQPEIARDFLANYLPEAVRPLLDLSQIKLEKDSASYCKTEITGNFYEYNTPAWEMISDYKITYVDHSVQVVFSTDTFEDTLLKQAADVFYANETIRNSATVTYYYLYDQNYADTTDYDYYMYVNAPNKEVTIYDKAGNIVREIRY